MLPSRRKSARLVVERLEDRCTPAAYGNPWPDAAHLTLSFAPDGTAAGSNTSQLFQTLNALAPTEVWQREVLRAFQTWAAVLNVNFGVVADGGQPIGAEGLTQGDARFGDIRLAAYAMAPDVLAVASPFEPVGGTWSGDIKLNTATPLSIGGQGGNDLFSVVLHEIGHALGLDENHSDPSSVMYESYVGPRSGLSTADIAAVRALYGPRDADANEGLYGNDTFSRATNIGLVSIGGITGGTASGDLGTVDADFYKFTVPLSLNKLVVRVQTLGASLLAPRVTVYNSLCREVAAVVSPGPNGGNLEISLNKLQLLSTYYVKIDGATSDVFSIGGYRVSVDSLPGVTGLVQTTGGIVADASTLLNVDLHTNDSILTASLLPQPFATANSRFDHAFRGSISDTSDVDFYKITAPAAAAGASNALTVMAWGLVAGGLDPTVSVWNSSGQQVAADILVNANSSHTIQVPDAVAGATYYVRISAARPDGELAVGNYFLGVDFSPHAVQLQELAAGTLNNTVRQTVYEVDIQRTVLQHFVLAVDRQGSTDAAVRMTIYDEANNIVHSMVAYAGEAVSADVLLGPGKYRIRFAGGVADATQPLPDLRFVLKGVELDDPIGPQPTDTTTAPSGQSSSPPPSSGTSSTQTDPDSSYTTWKESSATTYPSDPYGDPYSGS